MKILEKSIIEIGKEICVYLRSIKEIKECKIYGSIVENNIDKYSDIDIEIDVSGYDNSIFIKRITDIIDIKFPILYYDYARSLMPDAYIVTMAISEKNPFLLLDIKCTAKPHFSTISKENDFMNNKFTHIIKLFIANYKHYIRGNDCVNDILRMYKNIHSTELNIQEMLIHTYEWLLKNSEEKYITYLKNINIEEIKFNNMMTESRKEEIF